MIMNSTMPEDWNKPQPELAATIRKRLGPSRRVGSKWLSTYAESLLDIKATLEKWETLATAEERILAKHRGKTNREIVRDLVRWQAEVFAKIGDEDRAQAAIKRAVRLLDGSQAQITERETRLASLASSLSERQDELKERDAVTTRRETTLEAREREIARAAASLERLRKETERARAAPPEEAPARTAPPSIELIEPPIALTRGGEDPVTPAQIGERLVVATEAAIDQSAIGIGLIEGRVEFDRLVEILDRLALVTRLAVGAAAYIVGVGVRRVLLDDGGQ